MFQGRGYVEIEGPQLSALHAWGSGRSPGGNHKAPRPHPLCCKNLSCSAEATTVQYRTGQDRTGQFQARFHLLQSRAGRASSAPRERGQHAVSRYLRVCKQKQHAVPQVPRTPSHTHPLSRTRPRHSAPHPSSADAEDATHPRTPHWTWTGPDRTGPPTELLSDWDAHSRKARTRSHVKVRWKGAYLGPVFFALSEVAGVGW